ncbi:hypothetical protein ACL6C3_13975 [Capilliphycus salinus ALCB114379]|uniref:hypothetical protein n=1 Tax=Capilliphycus salinus TaxID=2768948 RepID=UPI0039A439A7
MASLRLGNPLHLEKVAQTVPLHPHTRSLPPQLQLQTAQSTRLVLVEFPKFLFLGDRRIAFSDRFHVANRKSDVGVCVFSHCTDSQSPYPHSLDRKTGNCCVGQFSVSNGNLFNGRITSNLRIRGY